MYHYNILLCVFICILYLYTECVIYNNSYDIYYILYENKRIHHRRIIFIRGHIYLQWVADEGCFLRGEFINLKLRKESKQVA